MELKREKEIVEGYHFDMKPQDVELETEINVGVTPLADYKGTPEGATALHMRFQFRLVFETYVLSGSVSQVDFVLNRTINGQEDIAQEEVEELVAPLFDMVNRLTYEVTEIALDEPGLQLNFESSGKIESKEA